MSKRKVKLIIICEDTQHECFARKFLYGMGWNYNQLRIVRSPSGRGSGEQWVRENYTSELEICRRSNVRYALLAIVDGDKLGVQGRMQQFDQKCDELEIPIRKPDDRAAIIVPTRNIETWIKFLEDNKVDETTSYPKLHLESECKQAVDRLVRYCKNNSLPNTAPASLQIACIEFRSRIQ